MKLIGFTFALFCLSSGILIGQSGIKYEAIRINDSQPIITQDMFISAGAVDNMFFILII